MAATTTAPIALPTSLVALGPVAAERVGGHVHVLVEHTPTGIKGWAFDGDVRNSLLRSATDYLHLRDLRVWVEVERVAEPLGGVTLR